MDKVNVKSGFTVNPSISSPTAVSLTVCVTAQGTRTGTDRCVTPPSPGSTGRPAGPWKVDKQLLTQGRQTVTESRETNSNRVKRDKQLQTQGRQTMTDSGERNNNRLKGDKQLHTQGRQTMTDPRDLNNYRLKGNKQWQTQGKNNDRLRKNK